MKLHPKYSAVESEPVPSRRSFLMYAGACSAMLSARRFGGLLSQQKAGGSPAPSGKRVVVVGAGAFGGWSALHLLRAGMRVTLIDSWGPGNSRASSGGETRIIRGSYGPNQPYSKMVARALQLFRENEKRWGLKLFHPIGCLMLPSDEMSAFVRGSLPMLKEAGLPYEELTPQEVARRYPQIRFETIKWAVFEPEAGYLTARRACEAVLAAFISEGGEYRQLAVRQPTLSGGQLQSLSLSDGSTITADQYVFACGPWLGKVFPDILGTRILPSRQEVFFFGAPAGDAQFSEEHYPCWIDHNLPPFYGIPGNQWRGFKIANDARGPSFDPTDGSRVPTEAAINAARDYIKIHFPILKDAPLLESRVCQYENSLDHQFIMDHHPSAANVWLVGGGSGHGFKHGPAIGEMVADLVQGKAQPLELFRFARLEKLHGEQGRHP